MFYQLPPVGNPVQLSRAVMPETMPRLFADGYQPHYYASGTAALAAAIISAIRLKAVAKPEVIVPAYGCPSLISAVFFAGAKPVLVDLEANRPWMDLAQLPEKISANTVAFVAVNLFGISERLAALRTLAQQADALLIEDSAQAFPSMHEQDIWQGDLVVLSFGRGKPVSLLGGGAVLYKPKYLNTHVLAILLPRGTSQKTASLPKQLLFWLTAVLYNAMINPRLYWLPQSLPFLHLGETRYQPLAELEVMPRMKSSLLPANIKVYQSAVMSAQKNLGTILDGQTLARVGIVDLAKACEATTGPRQLLRYPLLVNAEQRDQLYARLLKLGMGPSRMYQKALPEISGLETLLSAQGAFPAASAFAAKILTLPTHSQVHRADIEKMRQVLSP